MISDSGRSTLLGVLVGLLGGSILTSMILTPSSSTTITRTLRAESCDLLELPNGVYALSDASDNQGMRDDGSKMRKEDNRSWTLTSGDNVKMLHFLSEYKETNPQTDPQVDRGHRKLDAIDDFCTTDLLLHEFNVGRDGICTAYYDARNTVNGVVNNLSGIHNFDNFCDKADFGLKELNDVKDKVCSFKTTLATINSFDTFCDKADLGVVTLNTVKNSVCSFKTTLATINSFEDFCDKVDLSTVGFNALNTVKTTICNFPQILSNTINTVVAKPVKSLVDDGKSLLTGVKATTQVVVTSTVTQLKNIKFMPPVQGLANELKNQMMKLVAGNFCVPYDCIANMMGIQDLQDMELYANDFMSLSTGVNPKTCLSITEIEFDSTKLQDLLDQFANPEALQAIWTAVENFLNQEMGRIKGIINTVDSELDQIKADIDSFFTSVGLPQPNNRRMQLTQDEQFLASVGKRQLFQTEEGQNLTVEELSVRTYEQGRAQYEDLYGKHVDRVFRERRLANNPAQYIGLTSFKVKLESNIEHTFTVQAAARTGFTGTFFEESLHKSHVFPVPYTAGMVRLLASATMEASMPYTVSLEGAAFAEFGYSAGADATVDLVSDTYTDTKKPFDTFITVNATAGASGYLALKFAAAASLGVCVGPSDNACITVTLDAHQTVADGFDAVASVGGSSSLTALYADGVVDYSNQPKCTGDFSLAAGYWHYLQKPGLKVSLTSSAPCLTMDQTLLKLDAEVVPELTATDSYCLLSDDTYTPAPTDTPATSPITPEPNAWSTPLTDSTPAGGDGWISTSFDSDATWYSASTDPPPPQNVWQTWQNELNFCVAQGKGLCSYEELCPSGQYQNVLGHSWAGTWIAIESMGDCDANEWIWTTDCRNHKAQYGMCPHWGLTQQSGNVGVFNQIACCERPYMYYSASTDPAPPQNVWQTWQSERSFCVAQGKRLCSYDELCPSGQYQNALGHSWAGTWIAIESEGAHCNVNEWIWTADCRNHKTHYNVCPHWGLTLESGAVSVFNQIACCETSYTYYSASTDPAPPQNVWQTWQGERNFCAAQGKRLCSYEELCPSGQYQNVLGHSWAGTWIAIESMGDCDANEWIWTTDCRNHKAQYGMCPHWGLTLESGAVSVFNQIACCELV